MLMWDAPCEWSVPSADWAGADLIDREMASI